MFRRLFGGVTVSGCFFFIKHQKNQITGIKENLKKKNFMTKKKYKKHL